MKIKLGIICWAIISVLPIITTYLILNINYLECQSRDNSYNPSLNGGNSTSIPVILESPPPECSAGEVSSYYWSFSWILIIITCHIYARITRYTKHKLRWLVHATLIGIILIQISTNGSPPVLILTEFILLSVVIVDLLRLIRSVIRKRIKNQQNKKVKKL